MPDNRGKKRRSVEPGVGPTGAQRPTADPAGPAVGKRFKPVRLAKRKKKAASRVPASTMRSDDVASSRESPVTVAGAVPASAGWAQRMQQAAALQANKKRAVQKKKKRHSVNGANQTAPAPAAHPSPSARVAPHHHHSGDMSSDDGEPEDLMRDCPPAADDYTVSEAEAEAEAEAAAAAEAQAVADAADQAGAGVASPVGDLFDEASRSLVARLLTGDLTLTWEEIIQGREILGSIKQVLNTSRIPNLTDLQLAIILQADSYEDAIRPLLRGAEEAGLSSADLAQLDELLDEYISFLESNQGEPQATQGAVGTAGGGSLGSDGVGAVYTRPEVHYSGTVHNITPPPIPTPVSAVGTYSSAAAVDASVALLAKYTKSPKDFAGTAGDEPIRHWLNSMAHFLTTTRIPVKDGVAVAVSYLRGQAQQYWFSNMPNILIAREDPKSWETFKKWMVIGFGATDPEVEARYKLDQMHQVASVAAYVRELQAVFAQLARHPMSEQDKVHRFHTGLKPNVAVRVQMNPVTQQPWDTFFEAAQYAIRTDNAYTSSNMRSPTTAATTPGVLSRVSKIKGKQFSQDKPYLSENRRATMQAARAKYGKGKGSAPRNGGGGGHHVGSSRQAAAAGAARNAAATAERNRRFKEHLCLKCGQPGHQQGNCPNNQA